VTGADRLAQLEALMHREVPLSRHMAVTAGGYDGTTLSLSAALEPNINIHGTAFGGSLYCLAALCGWGLLRLRLEDLGLSPELVLGTARIDYRRPVRGRLQARASCAEQDFQSFLRRIRAVGRATAAVCVSLGGERDGEWREAAVFEGVYATA